MRATSRGDGIELEFEEIEGELLRGLIVDYLAVLGSDANTESGTDDPPPARLYPDAYPDDPEANGAFSARRRERLREHKIANAELVSSAFYLDSPIQLGLAVAERWLPLLTDLRLVLADRLGIQRDGDTVPDSQAGLIYLWLGGVQEELLASMQESS